MTDTDIAEVVAALRDLTTALRPALNPATRPTWDQQRWVPGPDAFGRPAAPAAELEGPAVFAVQPPPPNHVVPDELIESAWGNAVVDMFAWLNAARGITALGSPSVGAGAVQTVPWSSLSNQAWGAGPSLTAPGDTAGHYIISCNIVSPVIAAAGFADVIVNVGTEAFKGFVPGTKNGITVAATTRITPGTAVTVQVYNPNTAAGFFNTALNIYAVSP